MTEVDTRICSSMAHSLDTVSARMRHDAYLRKLREEQAANYRADAASE